jgi:phage gpG-like protein
VKIQADVKDLVSIIKKLKSFGSSDLNAEVNGILERAALRMSSDMKVKVGEVLNVRTGRLRRSISFRRVPGQNGTVSYMVGTRVVYGAVHEFGYRGTQEVASFERKNPRTRGAKRKRGKREAPKTHTVRAHTRNVNFPARSFVRPVFEKAVPALVQDLRKALTDRLNQTLGAN